MHQRVMIECEWYEYEKTALTVTVHNSSSFTSLVVSRSALRNCIDSFLPTTSLHISLGGADWGKNILSWATVLVVGLIEWWTWEQRSAECIDYNKRLQHNYLVGILVQNSNYNKVFSFLVQTMIQILLSSIRDWVSKKGIMRLLLRPDEKEETSSYYMKFLPRVLWPFCIIFGTHLEQVICLQPLWTEQWMRRTTSRL